jgi:hypothetical protein
VIRGVAATGGGLCGFVYTGEFCLYWRALSYASRVPPPCGCATGVLLFLGIAYSCQLLLIRVAMPPSGGARPANGMRLLSSVPGSSGWGEVVVGGGVHDWGLSLACVSRVAVMIDGCFFLIAVLYIQSRNAGILKRLSEKIRHTDQFP